MRLGQNSALNRKTSGVLPLGNFHWFFMYGRFDAYMYYALFIQFCIIQKCCAELRIVHVRTAQVGVF